MEKRKIIGRILVLLFNIGIIALITVLIIDKEWHFLIMIIPPALLSFYLEADELIHPDKYYWD